MILHVDVTLIFHSCMAWCSNLLSAQCQILIYIFRHKNTSDYSSGEDYFSDKRGKYISPPFDAKTINQQKIQSCHIPLPLSRAIYSLFDPL